ncbi:hypothetical protein PFISCL1PPCAC_13183, partial [Pristionchus fissidentatus]
VCQVGGIVDILAILVNYLLGILPARGYFLPFYLSTPTIGTTYLAFSWGIRYSQNITAIIMAVNRLTAILYPFRFRTFSDNSFKHGYFTMAGVIASVFVLYMVVNYSVVLIHFKRV